MSRGQYRMRRGWLEHPVLQGEPYDRRSAWAWLIEEATWQGRRCEIAGRFIDLQRGQLSHSTRFMAKAWGWSEARVRRFLTRLKTDAMIDAATDAGRYLITICNYDKYQTPLNESDALTDAPSDAEATQQRRKPNKGNKGNTYTVDFDEFWRVYPGRKPHSNPKKTARQKFELALTRGASVADITRGARNYAVYVERERVEPKFVAQAATWLNQERWTEYQEPPAEARPVDDGFL